MSDGIPGWTLDTLKAYFDARYSAYQTHTAEVDLRYQQRFDAQQKAVTDAMLAAEKAVNTALASADRAVLKAENSAERRFEAVNEFRATLADQAQTFMTRAEAEAKLSSLSERMVDLKGRLDIGQGSVNSHANTVTLAIAIGAVVVSIMAGVYAATGNHPLSSPPPSFSQSAPSQPGVVVSPAIVKP